MQGEELMEVIKQKAIDKRTDAEEEQKKNEKDSSGGMKMSPEMMKRMENMSDEDRQKMMERIKENGGSGGRGMGSGQGGAAATERSGSSN